MHADISKICFDFSEKLSELSLEHLCKQTRTIQPLCCASMNTILQTNIVRCLTQIAHSSMSLHKGLTRVAKKYFSISRKHLSTESKNTKMSSFTYKNNQITFRVLELTFCGFVRAESCVHWQEQQKLHFQRIPLLITTSGSDSPCETSHAVTCTFAWCWAGCERLGEMRETGSIVQSK